ncbi:MAG: hypothetical protein GY679_01075 [Mycoplasma sp.]|nr:hypothetical protein [Mycoplasma sp.]
MKNKDSIKLSAFLLNYKTYKPENMETESAKLAVKQAQNIISDAIKKIKD